MSKVAPAAFFTDLLTFCYEGSIAPKPEDDVSVRRGYTTPYPTPYPTPNQGAIVAKPEDDGSDRTELVCASCRC